jgi:hypothetical protein
MQCSVGHVSKGVLCLVDQLTNHNTSKQKHTSTCTHEQACGQCALFKCTQHASSVAPHAGQRTCAAHPLRPAAPAARQPPSQPPAAQLLPPQPAAAGAAAAAASPRTTRAGTPQAGPPDDTQHSVAQHAAAPAVRADVQSQAQTGYRFIHAIAMSHTQASCRFMLLLCLLASCGLPYYSCVPGQATTAALTATIHSREATVCLPYTPVAPCGRSACWPPLQNSLPQSAVLRVPSALPPGAPAPTPVHAAPAAGTRAPEKSSEGRGGSRDQVV